MQPQHMKMRVTCADLHSDMQSQHTICPLLCLQKLMVQAAMTLWTTTMQLLLQVLIWC